MIGSNPYFKVREEQDRLIIKWRHNAGILLCLFLYVLFLLISFVSSFLEHRYQESAFIYTMSITTPIMFLAWRFFHYKIVFSSCGINITRADIFGFNFKKETIHSIYSESDSDSEGISDSRSIGIQLTNGRKIGLTNSMKPSEFQDLWDVFKGYLPFDRKEIPYQLSTFWQTISFLFFPPTTVLVPLFPSEHDLDFVPSPTMNFAIGLFFMVITSLGFAYFQRDFKTRFGYFGVFDIFIFNLVAGVVLGYYIYFVNPDPF